MIFDNPIFKTWYTDTVEICRVVPVMKGNVTAQERKKITMVSVYQVLNMGLSKII